MLLAQSFTHALGCNQQINNGDGDVRSLGSASVAVVPSSGGVAVTPNRSQPTPERLRAIGAVGPPMSPLDDHDNATNDHRDHENDRDGTTVVAFAKIQAAVHGASS